jgi:N-acetylated-alpha-linked acidic dipeptidase
MFALWDGEEWGLLGSTEWAEEHAEELQRKAVAYLNTDSYSAGRLSAGGSHTLTTFVRQVARDVVDPVTGRSAADVAVRHELTTAKTAADSGRITARGFRVDPLGSGTDFEAFLEHLGVPTVSYEFDGGPTQGTYHSIYDSYDLFTRFLDPGFVYGRAQAAAVGTFALRLAEAPLLPFSFTDAAIAFRGFADDVSGLAGDRLGPEQLDMSPVLGAIERLQSSGAAYDRAYDQVMGLGSTWLSRNAAALRPINVELYRSEQDLLTPAGLPGREWFKHTMYATGVYTGFAPDPMPGVRQMIEAGRRADAQAEVAKVAEAIDRMATRAGRLGTQLGQLVAR